MKPSKYAFKAIVKVVQFKNVQRLPYMYRTVNKNVNFTPQYFIVSCISTVERGKVLCWACQILCKIFMRERIALKRTKSISKSVWVSKERLLRLTIDMIPITDKIQIADIVQITYMVQVTDEYKINHKKKTTNQRGTQHIPVGYNLSRWGERSYWRHTPISPVCEPACLPDSYCLPHYTPTFDS